MTRYFVAVAFGAACLIGSGMAHAEAYQPGEFLRLDLTQAALSPKPLGPPAQFEPVRIEARSDAVETAPAAKRARAGAAPPAAVRRKIARVRSNPLDANASDTRVQVWPCRSGGICSWRK